MTKFLLTILCLSLSFSAIAQNNFYTSNGSGVNDSLLIYINPGHGGYDADDRNMVVYPFSSGDTLGYYESKSNLIKGLYLRDLIKERGGKVIMSRVLNRSVDDRALSTIGAEATQNNCDLMVSIHSNAANGSANFPLTLYKGKDNQPKNTGSDVAAIYHWEHLKANELTNWSYNHAPHNARGDWSFYGSEDYLGVLRNSFIPSFLSEDSFHDYIPETYRWLNNMYCKLHAWFYLKTFSRFFSTGTEQNGIIAGTVKDQQRSFLSAFLPYTASYVASGKDIYKPLNGVKVTLKNNQDFIREYTTDNLFNGVFMFDNVPPGQYTLTYTLDKYQVKETTVTVTANEVTYDLCFMELDRSNPLQVFRHTPTTSVSDSVSTRTKLRMYFNFELDRASFENAFQITPAIEGRFEYSNLDRDVTFIPNEPFASKTLYTVNIASTAKHIGNVSMENNYQFSFLTKNKRYLQLIDTYPKDGMTNVHPNTQVCIIFDSPILSEGANVKMALTDLGGAAIQNEGILTNDYTNGLGGYFYRPKNLVSGSEYILNIDKTVLDQDSLTLMSNTNIRFKVTDKTDAPTDKVVDRFEIINRWKLDRFNSLNIPETGNQMVRYSTIAYEGTYSYRFLYRFTEVPNAHVTTKYITPAIEVTKNSFLGMQVFADLSYNDLSVIVGNSTDTVSIPVCNLDYAGWKFKEVSFSQLNEGVTYRIVGLRVDARTTFKQSQEGAVLVDNFAVYNESLTGFNPTQTNNRLTIFPNPVTSTLKVQLPVTTEKISYKLVSADGRVKLSGIWNESASTFEIPVSDLSSGVYILSVRSLSLGTLRSVVMKK